MRNAKCEMRNAKLHKSVATANDSSHESHESQKSHSFHDWESTNSQSPKPKAQNANQIA